MVSLVLDGLRDDLVDGAVGPPSRECFHTAVARHAPPHVFKAAFGIGLHVGHLHNGRRGPRGLLHAFRERVDGNLFVAADVEDLAVRRGRCQQTHQCVQTITDVCEVARLRPVAEDPDRLARQSRSNEVRQHHPVAGALPGTNNVEESCDGNHYAAFRRVCQRQKFIQLFGSCVRPTHHRRRPKDGIRFLAQLAFVLSVHFGCAGQQ